MPTGLAQLVNARGSPLIHKHSGGAQSERMDRSAISTILIAQLLVAAAIDYFGWMGQEKMSFAWRQWAGLGLMLAGVVLMKWTK